MDPAILSPVGPGRPFPLAGGAAAPGASLRSGPGRPAAGGGEPKTVEEAFQSFVAGTFYGQMLKALRKTTDEPAYMHGGKAEESFRNLLDQRIAEEMAREHGEAFSSDLFEAYRKQSANRVETGETAAGARSATAGDRGPRLDQRA